MMLMTVNSSTMVNARFLLARSATGLVGTLEADPLVSTHTECVGHPSGNECELPARRVESSRW
ncbi:MAG: hypothetical protein KBE65_09745 [Phycisphaerae bacterium]|nr:hypothetical protein [Phycisphaerae bacterium]